MELVLSSILILIILAFILETVDSSLGMMYGTLLSPILIGAGFDLVLAIPAILLSQAVGGVGGTIAHHKFQNADFKGFTRDSKIVLAMVLPGLFAVIIGVFAGIYLPPIYIKTYISILVIIMSILCLTRFNFKFKWWKHYALGIVAAFNKALSGGGFGPVTSTGGIIGGLDPKTSVATTTFSEVFICLAAFVLYVLFSGSMDIVLITSLCLGAILGGLLGPFLASRLKEGRLRKIVGVLGIISGIWLIYWIIQ